MFDLTAFVLGFGTILGMAFATWCASLLKRDVSIVDSMWSLFFFAAALTYAGTVPQPGPRAPLVLVLVGLWALRLAS
jgi:steroid 5-alpha reductase family enzyme